MIALHLLPLTLLPTGDLVAPVAEATNFGLKEGQLTLASDAFAWLSLGLIFVILGGFALVAYSIYRRSKTPNREQELIEELSKSGAPPRSGAAWERDVDWWKSDF